MIEADYTRVAFPCVVSSQLMNNEWKVLAVVVSRNAGMSYKNYVCRNRETSKFCGTNVVLVYEEGVSTFAHRIVAMGFRWMQTTLTS